MEVITDDALLTVVGLAVLSSQAFEKMFVLAARHAIKQSGALTIDDVVPVDAHKAFKQPLAALLKEISGGLEVDGLEERLVNYIEDRNVVVHRIVTDNDWSSDEGRETIKQTCLRVTTESLELHKIFTVMFGDWIKRFPGSQIIVDEYELFKMYESTMVPQSPIV